MLEFFRKNSWIAKILFLLIGISFLFFGIGSYNGFFEKSETVAQVDGHKITAADWDAAHKQEVERIRASNPRVDVKLLDTPQARYATLEKIVRERVIAAAAERTGLVITEQRLVKTYREDPTLASMRLPDGSLDKEKVRQLASQQGLTPAGLDARIKAEMASRQVSAGVTATGVTPTAIADLNLNAFLERRDVQIARFAAAEYAPKVVLTDTEMEEFYKANQSMFQSPEQASIEYVVVDLDTVKKTITLNESDVKTYYEQNKDRFGTPEERRASHILIQAPKAAPAEERQKARARAEELLAAVKKSPESFADLARKNSQDAGSATNGGDLDFFRRGAMLKPFEDAAFGLKKGEISGVVETDFGYHIIKLTDVKAAASRSFDEVRPEMEADLKKQQAQRKFAEVAETFTNTVYEQSDSLKPVVDKLKLEVRTAALVTRNPAPSATGALANAKFLGAIFSADSVEKKRNTEAVEVGPNQLASARIVQYSPARTLPFADVKPMVQVRMQAARGADLARKEGQGKLSAWKANPASASLPPSVTISRDQSQGQSQSLVDAVMRVDATKLPQFVGVDLGNQGYAVIQVNKAVPRNADSEEARKSERGQYGQAWANAEFSAYYEYLKEMLKVSIKVAKPSAESATASAQ